MYNVIVMGADIRKKTWFFTFTTEYDDVEERAYFTGVRAVRLDGGARFEVTGADSLERFYEALNNRGAVFAFCWNMGYFGTFCDLYALRKGMPTFKDAAKRKTGGRNKAAAQECFTTLYAGGRGVLSFRLTLKRTHMTHEYRSGKIGGLHTVEYRGLSVFFHERGIEYVAGDLGVKVDDELEAGRIILSLWAEAFTRLVGEDVLSVAYLRKVYTIGGAAKRYYLRIKCPNGNIKTYHKTHDADEEMEDYLRTRHLQLSGLCFFPNALRGELVTGGVKKYDVNGLYSATANTCGELTYPREATFEEFIRDRESGAKYIIIVRNFIAYRKPNMPNVFMDWITGGNGDVIQIESDFACFRELWDTLRLFYDFEEFDVIRVFKMRKIHDPAIVKYNDHFQEEKARAARLGDQTMRELAKNMLNNLVGKFTQQTKYVEIIPTYDAVHDRVDFKQGEVVDNWKNGHFDFVRGAYIYTMARVKVMQDVYHFCTMDGTAASRHYYTDTDSIITDAELPADVVDPFRLGAYKLEREYSAFGVIGKKVYYGRTVEGVDELTVAGIPKGLVMREIRELYGEDLTVSQVWQILLSDAAYAVPHCTRVSGGGHYSPVLVRVREIDIDKII